MSDHPTIPPLDRDWHSEDASALALVMRHLRRISQADDEHNHARSQLLCNLLIAALTPEIVRQAISDYEGLTSELNVYRRFLGIAGARD